MIKICEKAGSGLPRAEEVINKAEGTCPVDLAKSVARTAYQASCGKGTMCRDGMLQIYHIISDIAMDKGRPDDLDLLRELCHTIIIAADCELSEQAADLILISLEHHADDWKGHLFRKRCAAMVCAPFFTVHVNPETCTGCGECAAKCARNAIAGGAGMIHVVDNSICTRCGNCFSVCPFHAIIKAGALKPRCPDAPVPAGSFAGAAGGMRRRRRGGTQTDEKRD